MMFHETDFPMNRVISAAEAAEIAQTVLDRFVKTLPEVFGMVSFKNPKDFSYSGTQNGSDTRRARLWSVEEIKPEKCEHRFVKKIDMQNSWRDDDSRVTEVLNCTCADCGAKLKAIWQEETK